MFKQVQPVSLEKHGNFKVKPVDTFDFARGIHLSSVMIHEFFRAASTYPIVFVEDQNSSNFRPVVLLGLIQGENLFVNAESKWEATYIPAIIRRYPFALAKTQDESRFTVCIDEQSPFVTDNEQEEGQPLFENGEPSAMIERVKQYLGELQQMEVLTQQFCEDFQHKNMFSPLNMRVRDADAVRNISGAYAINEQRLASLSDEDFLQIRKKNYLPAIYTHLASLSQIERLIQLRKVAHPADEKDHESFEKAPVQ